MSRNLGALTLLDPSGPAWPVMGVLYLYYISVPDDGTYGPKHVVFIVYIIKSVLCLTVMYMPVLKHNECDVLEAHERYADEEGNYVRTW
jgi:hypothetical protein